MTSYISNLTHSLTQSLTPLVMQAIPSVYPPLTRHNTNILIVKTTWFNMR